MIKSLNDIALRHLNGVYIQTKDLKNEDKENILNIREFATIIKKFEGFGYTFEKSLALKFSQLNKIYAIELCKKVLENIKDFKSDKNYTVFYKNFPNEVINMSESEIYLNQILHYWFGYLPKDENENFTTENQEINFSEPSQLVNLSHLKLVTENDIESQNIKLGDPLEEVKMTQHAVQNEPLEEVNLTRSNRPAENPIAARFCTSSSRTRVTETTTTENTHRIRETTTGDVRSLCAALGISDTSTENFLRRYGAECVHEKAQLLETAMQTQSIRNPTGWLHAALKNGYTFSPRTAQQEEQTVQPAPTRTYIPPESDSVEESLTQPSPVKRPLHEFLTAQASGEGEVSMFAQEYLRRHGNPQGRASP